MEISNLAALQKRIQDMREFLAIQAVPDSLRMKVTNSCEVLSKILVDCWKTGHIDSSQSIQIANLLRELEDLNELIRLNGADTLPREFEK